MTDPEKVLESKRRKLAELDDENGEVYDLLKQTLPGFAMDSLGPRVELLIKHLKETGVFTEEQALDFEIEFHETVKEALSVPLKQVQERTRPQLAVVKKPNKLLDAYGRPMKNG